MEEHLLSLQDVMIRLHIHENTLYRYISKGMIPVVVLTRNKRYIREQDLEDFLKKHTGVYKEADTT